MLTYNIENRNGIPKTIYLYRCIKDDIDKGILKKGDKLPSKRSLSNHLSVSIITVENAYSLLQDEGYIESKPKSGFYVSQDNFFRQEDNILFMPLNENEEYDTDIIPYYPSFAKIIRRIISENPEIIGIKPPSTGCACLRNEISAFLKHYRNMTVNPKNIVVGSGAEYLYNLLVYIFSGKTIAIEKPSYEKIRQVYGLNNVNVKELTLLSDGISSSELNLCKADVLHVSPFHSFPSGITASSAKRREYIDWANKNNSFVVEDDFDSEFVYAKKPLDTLYSMDSNHRIIYLNTFSKSVAPSIRIGYMILPDSLLSIYEEKLSFLSCTVPVFEQYVLAEFIRNGSFERMLNKKRTNYLNKNRTLGQKSPNPFC